MTGIANLLLIFGIVLIVAVLGVVPIAGALTDPAERRRLCDKDRDFDMSQATKGPDHDG